VQLPKFLIVRYTHGSAGTFLTSILQSSLSVAHCDPEVAANRNKENYLRFIKKHFTKDMYHWLANEPRPQNVFNLHFISARFPRGDNLSSEEFLKLCQSDASERFWQAVDNNQSIPMIWCKKFIPAFFDNPKVVTIIIDKKANKWFHRALWYKKYGIRDQKIHLKDDDPYFNPCRAEHYKKFNNPYLLDQHPISFIKKNIIKSEEKKLFSDAENFNDVECGEHVFLSEILDEDLLVKAVNRICKNLNLLPIDEGIIRDLFRHWSSCNEW